MIPTDGESERVRPSTEEGKEEDQGGMIWPDKLEGERAWREHPEAANMRTLSNVIGSTGHMRSSIWPTKWRNLL